MCALGCWRLLIWYRLLTCMNSSPFGSCLTGGWVHLTADRRAYWPPFIGSFLQSGLCSSPSFLWLALLTDRLLEKVVWRILFPVEISFQPFHSRGRCPVNVCTWWLLTEKDQTRQREWCPIQCWIWASPFFLIFSIKCAGSLGSLVLTVLLVFSCLGCASPRLYSAELLLAPSLCALCGIYTSLWLQLSPLSCYNPPTICKTEMSV